MLGVEVNRAWLDSTTRWAGRRSREGRCALHVCTMAKARTSIVKRGRARVTYMEGGFGPVGKRVACYGH
jgi:hypothetical protein